MSDKQATLSRIVGVEEHTTYLELMQQLPEVAVIEKGYLSSDEPFGRSSRLEKMSDTDNRFKELDAVGLTVQVLSYLLARRQTATGLGAVEAPVGAEGVADG